jgi:hypothetical protein
MQLNHIETGDMVAVRTVHGILGRATRFFTRSDYTHVGVALWLGGELFLAELNGGRNHLVPISQLDDFDVYARPANISALAVEEATRYWLGFLVNYGFLAFVAIGFLNYFKIKIFVHWRRILVCSGYVVAIYERAGWPECSRVISPGELAAMLTLKFSVRPAPK